VISARASLWLLLVWLAASCKLKVGDGVDDPAGQFPCETSDTCPTSDNVCLASMCLDGQCVFIAAPYGALPAEEQGTGDCKHLFCDGEGQVLVEPAPFDLPADDGNPCTDGICDKLVAKQVAKVAGSHCGEAGVCNGGNVCGVCIPNEKRCEGAAVAACSAEGQWSEASACAASQPRCSDARCRGIEEIALGRGHACARFDDGAVSCWGANDDGQLGDAPDTPTWGPFRSVTLGARHHCGIKADGALWCWGAGDHGQLGHGQLSSSAQPVDTGLRAVVEVVLGSDHSCARTQAGEVHCWGRNDRGQCGQGQPTAAGASSAIDSVAEHRARPDRIGSVDATKLLLGPVTTCATSARGMACWGMLQPDTPASIEPEDGTRPTPEQKKQLRERLAISVTKPARVALGGVRQIAAGAEHGCALLASGEVQCWGAGGDQRLGVPGKDRATPVAVAGLGNVRQIALGAAFGCALDAAGAVACWGDNSSGQLGTGSDAPHGAAAKITSLGSVRTIHTGGAFACALTVAGELLCWGDNQAGQLGQGDPAVSRAPLPMAW
jgi:hypothetical protein